MGHFHVAVSPAVSPLLRGRPRRSLRAGSLALLLLAVSACDKDKPKDEGKKADPVAVPSGLVFNDFLPATGTAAGLTARDAGSEGGFANVGGGAGAEPEDPAAAAAGAAGGDRMKVTEPGAEPRALRKYTFAANRVDKRLLTLTQASVQSVGGQASPPQEITMKLALDLVPKQIRPTGAQIEGKVTKVELPGAPPQAAQMLATMNGLTGAFDVTSRGEAGEVSFVSNQQMKSKLAESVVQGLSQAVQLLLAPLPDKPIGVGAKWELVGQVGDQGVKRFTLKEVSNEGAVIDADIEIKVPRRAAQGPGGAPMFVEVDGKGHYTYQVRFDRMSPKVDGDLTINEKIEVSDPRSGQKQSVTQTQKAKHSIETVK